MVNKDIYDLLCNVRAVLDSVNQDEAKKIFFTLKSVLPKRKQKYEFSGSSDWIAMSKKCLSDIMKRSNLIDLFNKVRVKPLYRILADHQIYTTCVLCNKPIKKFSDKDDPDAFSLDHIIPKSQGGVNDLYNLQPAHKGCNNDKKNDMLYHAHCDVKIVVNIRFSVLMSDKAMQRQKREFRKREYWRHNGCGWSR